MSARAFTREDRHRYREKVRVCLDVFARLLSEARFQPERRSFGLEIELNLTSGAGDPATVNAVALQAIADPALQTELGRFNLEINIPPTPAGRKGLRGARGGCPQQPQQRRGARPDGRCAHHDDRDSPDRRHRAPAFRRVQP